MKNHRASLLAIPTIGLLLATTSCRNLIEPSVGTEKLSVAQTNAIESINASINSLELATSKDAMESRRRIAELEKQGERRRSELVAARQEIDRRGRQLTGLLTEVGKAATLLGVPGASSVTQLVGELQKRMSANEVAAAQAKTKADAVTETATTAAKAEAERASRTEVAALRAELEKQIQAGTGLIEQNKDLVTSFVESSRNELTNNKQAEAEFRRELKELATQFGVSKAEVEKLDASSVNQLLGLIAGGGGAGIAALLALLRTMGKSRASNEVEQLRRQLEKVADEAKAGQGNAAKGR